MARRVRPSSSEETDDDEVYDDPGGHGGEGSDGEDNAGAAMAGEEQPRAVRRVRLTHRRAKSSEAVEGRERLTLLLPRVARLDVAGHPLAGDDDSAEEDEFAGGPELPAAPAASFAASAPLKRDHGVRPLWVADDGRVFLETSSPIHAMAQDFLTAVAEPLSRPQHVHEYRLTPYSLYAAVSVGLETEDIVAVLDRLCKTALPPAVVAFVRACTLSYGKAKLVLHRNRYWVESAHADVLRMLLADAEIAQCRIRPDEAPEHPGAPSGAAGTHAQAEGAGLSKGKEAIAAEEQGLRSYDAQAEGRDTLIDALLRDEDSGGASPRGEGGVRRVVTHAFEVRAQDVERVKRRCIELDHPMLEEYDFRNDTLNPPLAIDLRPATVIRPYQERSLSKMFGNGRARSGIIVLPCGAGKTLVGITAACTVRKPTLVLCTSAVAVEQWRAQFRAFSTVRDTDIVRFTSEHKEGALRPGAAKIVVSTYTMVAFGGKRSHDAQRMMDFVRATEWGLLILDEVHVVPAAVFRRVLTTVAAHAKLGLTATLVREDDKIDDLNFLIGPKLYEANWLDLARQGHIARVQCAEVWCPVAADFYREYAAPGAGERRRRLLAAMCPAKFAACHFLVDYHERRGDKVIVFSDNVYALRAYALRLRRPHIYGGTGQAERMRILHLFQTSAAVNTLFLSKVGDTSIDLPEATCLIQISSHYGSRRQEAQRLGRILRAKRRGDEAFSAFFYSLVSRDTDEMYYSAKRQQFLVDQGYAFKVVTDVLAGSGMRDGAGAELACSTPREQAEVLAALMLASETNASEDEDDGRAEWDADLAAIGGAAHVARVRKAATTLRALSGADGMAYMEFNRPVTSATVSGGQRKRHALFRQRDRDLTRRG